MVFHDIDIKEMNPIMRRNKKTQIIAAVIVIILVAAMAITPILSALMY